MKEWNDTILNDEKRGYWIVQDEKGKVYGFCIAKKLPSENELEYIYLLPEVQGRGIGKDLMQKALSWLGGSKPIVLYGAAYNEKAIRLYEKFGFKLSNETMPPRVMPNGKELPSMKMVKKV